MNTAKLIILVLFLLGYISCSDKNEAVTTDNDGGSLSLSVVDTTNQPLSGTQVVLCLGTILCLDSVGIDTADANGFVAFSDLDAGDYLLVIQHGSVQWTENAIIEAGKLTSLGNVIAPTETTAGTMVTGTFVYQGEGWTKQYVFAKDTTCTSTSYLNGCLTSEAEFRCYLMGNSIVYPPAEYSQQSRQYMVDATDSAAACIYELTPMKFTISEASARPVIWIEEGDVFTKEQLSFTPREDGGVDTTRTTETFIRQ